jgi:hypothetical protein
MSRVRELLARLANSIEGSLQPYDANRHYWCQLINQIVLEVAAAENPPATNPLLCDRCKTLPPQLRGGWYSLDNGQWVTCAACQALVAKEKL